MRGEAVDGSGKRATTTESCARTKRAMRYVLDNPVRASLVGHPEEYPYAGSDRWTVAELLESL